MKKDIVILIPAYNPDEKLIKVIEELQKSNYKNIIVVNDGSNNDKIWKQLDKSITILKHDKNRGKGRALKTGFEYCLNKYKNILGIITMDADGQHLVKDVDKLYDAILKNKNSLILGCRDFYQKDVPISSRVGNVVFRNLFKLKTKKKITDTQTGFRVYPISIIDELINVNGERFEYETNVLFKICELNIKIIEVTIKTIYINKNESSHFNKLKDSINICKTIIK